MDLSCTVAVNISVCHEDPAGCPLAIGGVVAARIFDFARRTLHPTLRPVPAPSTRCRGDGLGAQSQRPRVLAARDESPRSYCQI